MSPAPFPVLWPVRDHGRRGAGGLVIMDGVVTTTAISDATMTRAAAHPTLQKAPLPSARCVRFIGPDDVTTAARTCPGRPSPVG